MALMEQYKELERIYEELGAAAKLGKVAARDAASMLYNQEKHGKGISKREVRGIQEELGVALSNIGEALSKAGKLQKARDIAAGEVEEEDEV